MARVSYLSDDWSAFFTVGRRCDRFQGGRENEICPTWRGGDEWQRRGIVSHRTGGRAGRQHEARDQGLQDVGTPSSERRACSRCAISRGGVDGTSEQSFRCGRLVSYAGGKISQQPAL